jgi:pimeloyl-ACP methyl ester carboxylesterase
MSSDETFCDFFYNAADGLRLHARVYGGSQSGERAAQWPIVCLPGLTRNARDFHHLALYLSGQAQTPRMVVAFDYRGRGQSDYDPDAAHYNVGVEAGDVLAGLEALGVEEAAFIGTSRGGLIIHILATMRPSVLKAIILNDIGPVIEAAGLAHIRSYLDRTPTPKAFANVEASLRSIHGADFPALTDADWAGMAEALYRETEQGMVPDFDPKLVDSVANLDLTQPLPSLWTQFASLTAIPLLTIRGANSRLLSIDTLMQMQARHPAMQTTTVEGQGHAPLLETGMLPAEIAAFVNSAAQQHGTK